MEQDPQKVPVHPKVTTDFVFITFFQKNSAQHSPVALRHLLQDFLYFLFCLFCRECIQRIGGICWKVPRVVIIV